MKKNLVILAILLLTCYIGVSQNISGTYNTDFKEMTITQNGNKVTGTYKHQNGRIEGTLNGLTLTGFWFQDNGKGKLVFEFNSDFSGYTGKWGYNDAAPASKWNGTRIGGGQAIITNDTGKIDGVFNTDFKEMTITQNGNKVTGTYKHQNGRIEGTLNGLTLTGFWFQDNGKGKLVFEFNSDFSGYTGKWGYNDAAPASKWNGTRVGVSQTSLPAKQTTGQIAQPSIPKIADAPTGTSVKLNVDLTNTDAVVGDLKQNSIQLIVSKGTFDQQIKLQVKETGSTPQFDKKRANLIGTPFEITIDQKSKRLYKPVQVKVKLEQTEIAALNHPGDLWIGYFNRKSWDYFKPLEVNLSEKYVKFETYHFSDYAKAQLTKGEIINDFAYKNAISQWVENDNNALTKQATEQMVSEILSKKMGLNNKSLAQDVVEAMMQENDYTSLLVNYNDGNMEDFSQNVAVLAGKKICDIVTSDSNAKGLLGMVTEHSSKVGTAVKVAVALSEGDGEAAAKELSMEILNSFPLTKLLTTTARLTEMQINRWKNQELEAAYQAFVNGADSSLPWGFQVEQGNFEELWSQLRGLEPKIYSDAIDNYAALKGMKTSELNSVVLDKIRRDAKENMRLEFEKRKNQESRIEKIKAENIKLISEFEKANLLSRSRFGFTDATDFDFRIERLFRIKDMILKDTKSRLGFSGVDDGGIISAQTIAALTQIWYSDNGKEKYRQELIRRKYLKEDKPIAISKVEVAKPTPAPPKKKSPAAANFNINFKVFVLSTYTNGYKDDKQEFSKSNFRCYESSGGIDGIRISTGNSFSGKISNDYIDCWIEGERNDDRIVWLKYHSKETWRSSDMKNVVTLTREIFTDVELKNIPLETTSGKNDYGIKYILEGWDFNKEEPSTQFKASLVKLEQKIIFYPSKEEVTIDHINYEWSEVKTRQQLTAQGGLFANRPAIEIYVSFNNNN